MESYSLPCIKPPFPDPSKWTAIAAEQRTQRTSLDWAIPSENYYNSFALYPQMQVPVHPDYDSSRFKEEFVNYQGDSANYKDEEEEGEYEEVLVMNDQWVGTFSKALQKMKQKVEKAHTKNKWTRAKETKKKHSKQEKEKGKIKEKKATTTANTTTTWTNSAQLK